MPSDDLLDHPDLQALDALERREAEAALKDPDERDRLILRTLLCLRAEQKAARVHCRTVCAPEVDKRLQHLERWRIWCMGLSAGVGFAAATLREWVGLGGPKT